MRYTLRMFNGHMHYIMVTTIWCRNLSTVDHSKIGQNDIVALWQIQAHFAQKHPELMNCSRFIGSRKPMRWAVRHTLTVLILCGQQGTKGTDRCVEIFGLHSISNRKNIGVAAHNGRGNGRGRRQFPHACHLCNSVTIVPRRVQMKIDAPQR